MKKVILSADSTSDIGSEIQERFDIRLMPYTIISKDKAYTDNVDITPSDLFEVFYEDGSLPQTSAVNEMQYRQYFNELLEEADEVVHLTLGGAITSSANNAQAAAEGDQRIHVVDSQNLSGAMAVQLIRAGEMMEGGASATEIADELKRIRTHTHGSFVLDTLEFMKAGGRCSNFAAIASNLLNIKPQIQVDNRDGSMYSSKKYRGSLEKVVRKYVNDQMDKYDDIIPDHVFITHTDIDQACVDAAREVLEERIHPKNIHETTASCTISCHCGPGTIGVLFLTEGEHIDGQ